MCRFASVASHFRRCRATGPRLTLRPCGPTIANDRHRYPARSSARRRRRPCVDADSGPGRGSRLAACSRRRGPPDAAGRMGLRSLRRISSISWSRIPTTSSCSRSCPAWGARPTPPAAATTWAGCSKACPAWRSWPNSRRRRKATDFAASRRGRCGCARCLWALRLPTATARRVSACGIATHRGPARQSRRQRRPRPRLAAGRSDRRPRSHSPGRMGCARAGRAGVREKIGRLRQSSLPRRHSSLHGAHGSLPRRHSSLPRMRARCHGGSAVAGGRPRDCYPIGDDGLARAMAAMRARVAAFEYLPPSATACRDGDGEPAPTPT